MIRYARERKKQETDAPEYRPTNPIEIYKRFVFNGAPGGTRTPGLLIRSQSLYPAELRARVASSYHHNIGD